MPSETSPTEPLSAVTGQARGYGWIIAPLAIFIAMAGLFALALKTGDPSKLPSAMIGRPAPPIELSPLAELTAAGRPVPGFATADLADGTVSVVNFWASWCAPCVDEHPLLEAIRSETGVRMIGVNYKDQPAAARRFLGRYGNPFSAIGVDGNGRAAIDWGVYGTPETFVVDGKGRIVYKHVGPISAASMRSKVVPAILAARAASK